MFYEPKCIYKKMLVKKEKESKFFLFYINRLTAATLMEDNIKKRFAWYILAAVGVIPLSSWGYSVLGYIFGLAPLEYQWVLGLLSPLVREMFVWMLQEVSYKGAGEGSRGIYSIRLSTSHYMEVRHAIFLAVILGSIATPATSYCIIGLLVT